MGSRLAWLAAVSGLLLGASAPAAAQPSYYRWVDDKGGVVVAP